MWRALGTGCLVAVLGAGCAAKTAAPPPASPAPPAAPVIPIERKAAWILRLEQQRVLRDSSVGADLVALTSDADAGVRRRAALALGRIGDLSAVPTLVTALSDSEEAVRGTAAFSLGLLGDAQAVPALQTALSDTSAIVRGRAAEGLGLIGAAAASAASAIATSAASCPAAIARVAADTETTQTPEIEACRLSMLALVRLRNYDALARVVLNAQGQPVSVWWPVAFALQRSGDARAADPLVTLAATSGIYTQAFAIRGLAALKDARVVKPALALATRADADIRLRAVAIRALGQLREASAVAPLLAIVKNGATPRSILLETLDALGAIGSPTAFDAMLDLFGSSVAPVRLGAMSAASKMDPEGFLLALSSAERDKDWTVRAGLATVLAALPADRAMAAVEDLATDNDTRVQAAALPALVKIGAADIDRRLFDALAVPDFALRATAAGLVGDRRPAGGVARLAAAYERGDSDATPTARLAAVDALARYTTADVIEPLTKALSDRDYSVRLRAATVLREHGQPAAAPVRPAPLRQDPALFESNRLLHPAFSPQAFIETSNGMVQIQLDVVDAPLTTIAFIDLARSGFFNGLKVHRMIPNFVVQTGDPRGDGEGGPGYTIRDELGMQPYVRGTVGMALGGAETGGSQFFIALSPQPHLDGRYSVFGKVVAGWDVLDRIALGDVILRILIQDGDQ
jgi:cyclophilin family peptidyl-prolyl cis-trans isomerase/HEAT repeat protein